MVDIVVQGDVVAFRPRGWSRLWTLQGPIQVPLSSVRTVKRAAPGVGRGWWKGWRLPGTHLPGLIVAGSYLNDGIWTFWDVRGSGKNAIELEVDGQRYHRLIVDVADPAAEVRRLQEAIAARA